MVDHHCQCEAPIIRCDHLGCRCETCGLMEDIFKDRPAHPDSATPSGDGGESATSGEIEGLVREAYDMGFAASGEGWNGEYPDDATEQEHYARRREDQLFALLSRITSPSSKNTPGRRPDGHGLTLRALHEANKARQTEWCQGGDPEPDLAFRGNELAGKVGEACNVVKKLERERHGWRGSRATLDDLAQELADVVICADLCAVTAGIDLDAAVIAKFNATSEKQGLTTKLPHPDPTTGGEAPGRDDGWVLVPREPTLSMYEAGYDATRLSDGMPQFADAGFCLGHAGNIYRAMLSASPRSSQKEGGRSALQPQGETDVQS